MQQADLSRMRGRAWLGAAAALLPLLCVATTAPAQQPDTIRPVELAPVVVTGERVRTPLASSTTAVAKLAGEDLRARPVRSVAEALEAVPGLSFLDVDGLGLDPQLTMRGFYGGGEAEYVVVLLDGKPLNGLEAGLFDWDLVPVSSLESIEVVRGGTSSLYGDAAVGGVINLVTRAGGRRGGRFSVGGGELGVLRASLDLGTSWRDRPVTVFGAFRRAEGFREHAARGAGSAGVSLGLWHGSAGELALSTLSHWRSYDEPGPLTAPELATSRTAVHPFYRFDTGDEWLHRLTLDGRGTLRGGEASAYLAGELRSLAGVRTLPLSPEFADTKERALRTSRLLGSAQVRWGEGVLPAPGALLVGVDGSAGRLRNEHYQVVTGDPGAYRGAAGERGALSARGEGERLGVAAFARYEVRPAEAVRLTAGGRLDWLRDTFRPELPAAAADHENTHVAFSPQAGVNVRYLASARQEGHVFANIGRSFKAPTLDQLFDQRSIPIPFDPFELTLSNPELEPARGSSIEAGLYQQARLIPQVLTGSLSLAAYQLDMENELDVDLQSFRYVNIGRSRHRGIEAGGQLEGPGGVGAYGSYTLQDVVFRYGEYRGNGLKAIPRHSVSAGVRAGGRSGPAGSVSAHSAWGVWLDDANRIELPGYTRLDGRLSYALARVRLELEVFNLLDGEYSTTGYPDPAGSGTVYYYPAAGRVLQVGLSAEW